jgi:hypothetical protein
MLRKSQSEVKDISFEISASLLVYNEMIHMTSEIFIDHYYYSWEILFTVEWNKLMTLTIKNYDGFNSYRLESVEYMYNFQYNCNIMSY